MVFQFGFEGVVVVCLEVSVIHFKEYGYDRFCKT